MRLSLIIQRPMHSPFLISSSRFRWIFGLFSSWQRPRKKHLYCFVLFFLDRPTPKSCELSVSLVALQQMEGKNHHRPHRTETETETGEEKESRRREEKRRIGFYKLLLGIPSDYFDISKLNAAMNHPKHVGSKGQKNGCFAAKIPIFVYEYHPK